MLAAKDNTPADRPYPSPPSEKGEHIAMAESLDQQGLQTVAQVETRTEESTQPAQPAQPAQKPGEKPAQKQSRKRKPEELAPALDKPTKTTARASQRRRKATPKAASNIETKTEHEQSPPPPPPPQPISKLVSQKVQQVCRYAKSKSPSRLDHSLENKALVSVPESYLVGALTRVRDQYQLDDLLALPISTASIDDVIVKRFQQPIGDNADIDWVTIDVSKRSRFEEEIHETIRGHGLSNSGLLELELEMVKRDHLAQLGMLKQEDGWSADRFLRTFEEIWKKVLNEEAA